jgi:hypothetical protein
MRDMIKTVLHKTVRGQDVSLLLASDLSSSTAEASLPRFACSLGKLDNQLPWSLSLGFRQLFHNKFEELPAGIGCTSSNSAGNVGSRTDA